MMTLFFSLCVALYVSLFLFYINHNITEKIGFLEDDIARLQEDLINLQVQFSVHIDKKGE